MLITVDKSTYMILTYCWGGKLKLTYFKYMFETPPFEEVLSTERAPSVSEAGIDSGPEKKKQIESLRLELSEIEDQIKKLKDTYHDEHGGRFDAPESKELSPEAMATNEKRDQALDQMTSEVEALADKRDELEEGILQAINTLGDQASPELLDKLKEVNNLRENEEAASNNLDLYRQQLTEQRKEHGENWGTTTESWSNDRYNKSYEEYFYARRELIRSIPL